MLEEFNLTFGDEMKIIQRTQELQEQAQMLDMDIDWETDSLTIRRAENSPQWLLNWQAKQEMSDIEPRFDNAEEDSFQL